jgi:hypothetical protein
MADFNTQEGSLNFNIVDTVNSPGQELIDSFLDDIVTPAGEVKGIDEKDTPTPAPVKKVEKKVEKEEEKEEEVPFDLSDIKEEGDEDDVDEKDNEEDNEEKQDNEEDNPFITFSKELFNLNAFIKDEDEEVTLPKTGQEFLNLMNEQLGKRSEIMIQNYLNRFGEDYQEAFDAIFVNGVNPKEYYKTYNEIESFTNLDLDEEGNQELVIRKKLKDLEYEDDEIQKEVSKLKEYGDLKEAAEKYHKVLVKQESKKLSEKVEAAKQKQESEKQRKAQLTSTVTKVLQDKLKTKDFDGIPVNPELAKEVYDMLVVEKWKTSTGEPLTDFDVEIMNLKRPENHETKVKYALLLKLLKNDPTLATIKKAGVTKETNELFSSVVKNKPKSTLAKKTSGSPFNRL